MRPFEWSDEYSVSVPEIDAEHQAMFQVAFDLYRALIAGTPPAQSQPIIRELATHAADHFAHEERLMRESGYPLLAWHRRQHAAANGKIKLLDRRLRREDRNAALLAMDLSVCLQNHIRLADRMLCAYLRNHRRAQTALAS